MGGPPLGSPPRHLAPPPHRNRLRQLPRRLRAVARRAPAAAAPAAFLPWLLSPPDSSAANRRRARCVFSSASSRGRATANTDIFVRDRRWVV
ncbi:unnamed protein product, partial [Urochloa humidicola]